MFSVDLAEHAVEEFAVVLDIIEALGASQFHRLPNG